MSYIEQQVLNNLVDFFREGSAFPKNTHFYYKWGEIYVRRSVRVINQTRTNCIDLGSISVLPEFQRQGIFKNVLADIEAYAILNKLGVYVESILNPVLIPYLTHLGYFDIGYKPPTMVKLFDNQ